LPTTSRNKIFTGRSENAIAAQGDRCRYNRKAFLLFRVKTEFMKKHEALKQQIAEAMAACQDKKAESVTILEMEKGSNAFTDYFLICSGVNPRQVQAIADEVEERLEKSGQRVTHKEGYSQAEWVLLDYVDFVVHIFSEKARQYYDLERLWKTARRLGPADLNRSPKKATAKKSVAKAKKSVSQKAARKSTSAKPVRKPARKKKK
jgi:ribosome-associated protein